MTDHIGEATEKVDLDALEKLADALREVSFHNAAEAAGYGFASVEGEKRLSADLKALISELREARGLLEEVTDDLKSEIDARYDGMLPQLEARYSRDLSTVTAARAFLARNGKGEG